MIEEKILKEYNNFIEEYFRRLSDKEFLQRIDVYNILEESLKDRVDKEELLKLLVVRLTEKLLEEG